MVTTRLGLAVVGAFCLVAAGAGGFLATRQAADPERPAAVSAQPGRAPEAQAALPVEETETILDEQPAKAPRASAAEPGDGPKVPANRPAAHAARPAEGRAPSPSQRRAVERPAPAPPTRAGAPPAAQEPRPSDTPVATEARAEATRSQPVDVSGAEMPRRVEPVEQPRWQEPQLEELVVAADSVMGLQLKHTVTSELARIEDRVEAQVARDVAVDGRVAIPAGSRVLGAVTLVERGGKVRERARLGVRFHTLVLTDGTTLPIQTDTVYREGESPANSSAAKMGGAAIGGAIVGAILGGGKGAAIGGAAGAAGGTAAVMAGSRRPATFNAGSTVTVRVLSPVTVTSER